MQHLNDLSPDIGPISKVITTMANMHKITQSSTTVVLRRGTIDRAMVILGQEMRVREGQEFGYHPSDSTVLISHSQITASR